MNRAYIHTYQYNIHRDVLSNVLKSMMWEMFDGKMEKWSGEINKCIIK